MILIAVGANLPSVEGGDPLSTCHAAAVALRALPGLVFVAQSHWYRTAAMPVSDQPDYCNGVLRFAGQLDPLALLHALQTVEANFGRVRSIPNAARTLDLDLIDVNREVLSLPALQLPHPRAHERAFVLQPVLDVAPDWVHPLTGQGVTQMLALLPPQGIQHWDDPVR